MYNKENSAGFSIDKDSKIPDKLEEIYFDVTEENLKRAFDVDVKLVKSSSGRLWAVVD